MFRSSMVQESDALLICEFYSPLSGILSSTGSYYYVRFIIFLTLNLARFFNYQRRFLQQ